MPQRPSTRARSYFRGYALFSVFRRKKFALLTPTTGGKVVLVRGTGTVVPLLTNTASAPWRPSHAPAPAMLHNQPFPRQWSVWGGGGQHSADHWGMWIVVNPFAYLLFLRLFLCSHAACLFELWRSLFLVFPSPSARSALLSRPLLLLPGLPPPFVCADVRRAPCLRDAARAAAGSPGRNAQSPRPLGPALRTPELPSPAKMDVDVLLQKPIVQWSTPDLVAWLQAHDLQDYSLVFEKHKVWAGEGEAAVPRGVSTPRGEARHPSRPTQATQEQRGTPPPSHPPLRRLIRTTASSERIRWCTAAFANGVGSPPVPRTSEFAILHAAPPVPAHAPPSPSRPLCPLCLR